MGKARHPGLKLKDKVVFVLGPTGSGKSKLAIALATHFDGEVVNSDKIQVYDGLDVITNKVTEEESAGIPHHLIGGVHPDADFTAPDFRREAMLAVDSIVRRRRVPIIAGGSNSYIEALVDGEDGEFRSRYECCFVWMDVEQRLLDSLVSERVDKMVKLGLVEEARSVFRRDGDYSRGVRRSIGVPEMDGYFRLEASVDNATRAKLLAAAIEEVKDNARKLTRNQLQKIRRFCTLPAWDVHRIDATEFFLKRGHEGESEAEAEAWERVVEGPGKEIVGNFLSAAVEVKHVNGENGICDGLSKGENESGFANGPCMEPYPTSVAAEIEV